MITPRRPARCAAANLATASGRPVRRPRPPTEEAGDGQQAHGGQAARRRTSTNERATGRPLLIGGRPGQDRRSARGLLPDHRRSLSHRGSSPRAETVLAWEGTGDEACPRRTAGPTATRRAATGAGSFGPRSRSRQLGDRQRSPHESSRPSAMAAPSLIDGVIVSTLPGPSSRRPRLVVADPDQVDGAPALLYRLPSSYSTASTSTAVPAVSARHRCHTISSPGGRDVRPDSVIEVGQRPGR